MSNYRKVLFDLWIGIAILGILILGIGVWFVKNPLSYILGLLLGLVTAAVLAKHMHSTIEKAMARDDGKFATRMRLYTIMRYGIVIVVLVVACISPYTNPIATFIGTLTLKLAAYLQPLTHKLSSLFFGKDEPYIPESSENPEETGEEIEKPDSDEA